jgi:hypothetical protein
MNSVSKLGWGWVFAGIDFGGRLSKGGGLGERERERERERGETHKILCVCVNFFVNAGGSVAFLSTCTLPPRFTLPPPGPPFSNLVYQPPAPSVYPAHIPPPKNIPYANTFTPSHRYKIRETHVVSSGFVIGKRGGGR